MMALEMNDWLGGDVPKVYKTEEIRKILLLKTRQSVLRYIKNGHLKARKIGRDYIVLEKDLEAFLNGRGTSIKELTDSQLNLWGEEDG